MDAPFAANTVVRCAPSRASRPRTSSHPAPVEVLDQLKRDELLAAIEVRWLIGVHADAIELVALPDRRELRP